MEVTLMGRLTPAVFGRIVKTQLADTYTKTELRQILSAAKKEYKAILARIPPMGGTQNMMIGNMYQGAYALALYRQIRGKVSLEQYQQYILDGMRGSAMVKKRASKVDMFSDATRKRFADGADWAKQNRETYPWTWQFTVSGGNDDSDFYVTFTNCGLCHLLKTEGLPELTPLLCETDYVTVEMAGARLTRTKTLAEGAECCDFVYQR